VAANRLADGLFHFGMVTHYVAGTAGFRLLSVRKGFLADALGPCILVLFAAVDGLYQATASRWALLLLALGFGYINAVSSEQTGGGRANPIRTLLQAPSHCASQASLSCPRCRPRCFELAT
jgi:hypothetical protein